MASNTSNGDDLELRVPRSRQPSATLGRLSFGIQRVVAELQDQQKQVQKRTFTRWMNSHLSKWRPPLQIKDLFEDIQDGTKLIALLQILSGERLPIEAGRKSKRVHHLSNMKTALEFLETKKIKLVNINGADIVDGKPSIVLGLLWTIILFFQHYEVAEKLSIEELTNNLGFSSDLSASTSSLDSFAEEGGPAKKKKTGARSKWKGAAKKALLQWVKKKTASNPVGFNIAAKDFGASWRDGRLFLSMIHTIEPELIDPEEVEKKTNKQNLEYAFDTAENRLGIPRLLEPEDVDVDRPDEKSIMTYVAQFVNKYAGVDKGQENLQVDENIIQYEDIMSWLMDAEGTLADVHKRFKYQGQDYKNYKQLLKDFEKRDEQAQILRKKWSQGSASSLNEEQVNQMDNLLNKIDQSTKKWHRQLDSRLPGHLGEVGAWLHDAEAVMSKEYNEVADEEEMADVVKRQLDDHRALFKNKKMMEQNFSKGRRGSKFSGQVVPEEQLRDIHERLARITTASVNRMAQLEFMETKSRSLGFLATAETMLKAWTVKYGGKQSVEILLQNYKETINKGNFIGNFKSCCEKLLDQGNIYLNSDISPDEKEKVKMFLDDKETQIADVCIELQSVQSMLEEVRDKWTEYEDSVTQLQPWLEEAETTIKTKGKKGKDFFHDLPTWVQTHALMNSSGNFLIETCDEAVSKDVKQQLLLLNGRWKQIYEVCKVYMKEEELKRMSEEFTIGVSGLQKWLQNVQATLNQPLPFEYQPVKEYLQDLEEIRDETHQVEEKYKALSKLAQGLVKDTPQEEVTRMLKTMTDIKDELIKVRGTINGMIGNCTNVMEPLQDIAADLESLEEWLESAQSLLSEYENPDKDLESLFQRHQQFFARMDEQPNKLAKIGEKLERIKQLNIKGLDVGKVQDKLTEASAKLQMCMQSASEWKPKLKSGMETTREYRKHLGIMQRWLQQSEQILTRPLDDDTPKELMTECQNFFSDMTSSPLPAFLQASKKLQDSQASESERSKVHDMTNEIQQQYQTTLKRSAMKLVKLKFLEAEDKFNALTASCQLQLDDEEAQLEAKSKSNKEQLEGHKAFFNDAFLKLDQLLNSIDAMCRNLNEGAPDDYTWTQKSTELREEYEDLVTSEEEMYTKLTELPQKWEEFHTNMNKVKQWVKEAETVMESVHKPVDGDPEKFKILAGKFNTLASSRDEHLNALEWLSSMLVNLAQFARPEEVQEQKETLMNLTASSKAVINALEVTERRVESVQTCMQYKDDIQETLDSLDCELKQLQTFCEDAEQKPVNSLEEATSQLAAYQNMMNSLDSLALKVNDDVNLGKELHSDEQAPSFLYSEVSGLEKKWKDLQDFATMNHKQLIESVDAWQEHDKVLSEINDFVNETIPALETRLRLSNINAINQELQSKMDLKNKLDRAVESLKNSKESIAVLSQRASDEGKESLKNEHEMLNEKLNEIKDTVDKGISKAQEIKKQWLNYEDQMLDIQHWIQDIQIQISENEQSQVPPEEQFSHAQELSGVILAKSHELNQLEERFDAIEGIESPSTLHAKLATVRGKWEQVYMRAQALVTGLGENLSHQEKFETTLKQVEDHLLAAEQHLNDPLEACESSDDIQDRKDEHLKFCHSLEQVRLGLTTLQSEAKLLKDPSKAQSAKNTLNKRYGDILTSVKSQSTKLDDASSKWLQFEKKVNAVRQYIEKCQQIVDADQAGLPGDPQKLRHELQLADKLSQELRFNKDSIQALRDIVDEIDVIVPVDTDSVLTQLSAMDVLLQDLPQQFSDRKNIISAALSSHLQYNETIDRFTNWLLGFEKSLRITTDVFLDDVDKALDTIKGQRSEIECHQNDYHEIASHLEDLRTMCDPLERKTLISRYTECTKFLGRVCEVVAAREEALDKLMSFHTNAQALKDVLERLQNDLKTAVITSDQLLTWQQEAQDMKNSMGECMSIGSSLDQVLQHAQLTAFDSVTGRQRTTVIGYINRLEAKYDLILSELTIKQEHFYEVDNIWRNFLDRKERLLKAVDAIEEEADSDIEMDTLTQEELHRRIKTNDKLKDDLEGKRYELNGLKSKGKQLSEADPSQEGIVKEHLKLVDMSWEDAETSLAETNELLTKILTLLKDYEAGKDVVTKVLKNAETVASTAEAPRHFSMEEVKRHLQKLESLKQDLDDKQSEMDDMTKKGKLVAAEAKKIIICDTAVIYKDMEELVDRYLDIQDKVEETLENLKGQLGLWKELAGADEEIEEWMNTSISELNASVSSLDDSAALMEKLKDVNNEIKKHKSLYENLQNKVSEMSRSRRKSSVGEMDELTQVNENMKSKLEKANAVYKQAQLKLEDFTSQQSMLSKYVNELYDWINHKEETMNNMLKNKQPEHLKKAREIHSELSGQQDNVESAKEHLNNLCRKYQASELESLQSNVAKLTTAYENVFKLSADVIKSLEGNIDGEFNASVKDFYSWYIAGVEVINDCADTAGDIPALEERLQKLQNYADKIEVGQSKVNAAVEVGARCVKDLPRSADDVDQQLCSLKEDWHKFLGQLEDQRLNLETSLSGLRDLEENRKELAGWLKTIEKQLRDDEEVDGGLDEKVAQFKNIQALNKDLSSKSGQIETLMQQAYELVESDSTQSNSARKSHQLISVYHGICKKAKERLRECEQNVNAQKQYEESLLAANEWIRSAVNKLDLCIEASVHGTDKDNLEGSLNTVQDIFVKKQEGEVKLNVALGKGERAMNTSSHVGKILINKEMNELKLSHDDFIEKLSQCKSRLERRLLDWAQYEQAKSEMSSWLNENETVLSGSLAPSVDLKDKEVQYEKYKLIREDVESHVEALKILENRAEELNYDNDMQDMHDQYDRVRSLALERAVHLESRVTAHESYYEAVQDFCSWMNSAKEELNRWADFSGDKESVEKKLNKIQGLKASRTRGRQKLDAATEIGNQVIQDTAESGRDVISTELVSLKEEWRSYDRAVTETEISLESRISQLSEYEKSYSQERSALEDKLAKFFTSISELELKLPQESNAELTKSMNAFKTKKLCQNLLKELEKLQEPVDELKNHLNVLCRSYQNTEIDELPKRVTDGLQKYDNMKLQLSKLKSQCERNLLEAFQTSARDFESWLKTKKELVQNYGEVSGNRDAAKHKLENIQELLTSAEEGKIKLGNLVSLGDDLPEILGPESSDAVRQQTKQCKESWRNFLAMIQDKEQSLESYVDQLTDFDSSVIELTEWLKEIEEKFQSEDGLKATIGLKKSQFNSLQAMSEDTTDQNYKFERLKRKAHKLGSASELSKLNMLTSQYHTISKQIQDSLKRSEQNLSQHQTYQSSFTESQEWINDFTRRLDTYSNMAGDKAMLEQRLNKLENLLSGKQEGEVKINITTGQSEKALPTTAPKGRPAIEDQVKSLLESFERNIKQAQEIRTQLGHCIELWEKYDEAVKTAQTWLQETDVAVKAEKILHSGPNLPSDSLFSDLEKCQTLYRDIKSNEPMIENVQQCANNIASVTGDVYGTRVDIAEIREQYQELMNEVQELLNEAEIQAESAKTYHQALHIFTDWFSGKTVELFRLSDTSCGKDILQSNIESLQHLKTEIPEGESKLKQAIQAGKRSSPDKSIKLQLQNLRDEWNEYRSKLDETLIAEENLLQEMTKYEKICREFEDWITAMEICPDSEIFLSSNLTENRELVERFKLFSNEIAMNRSKLDRLNKAAQQLVNACGSSNGSVSMQVTQMTSRYQTLLIRTKDKLAKYQSIVKLQSEFDEEADDFDKWLATTDEKFAMYTLPENIDAENAQLCCDNLDTLLVEFESHKMALSLIADKSSKLAQLLDLAHTEGIKEQTKAQHEDFQELYTRIQAEQRNLRRTLHYYEDYRETFNSFKSWLADMTEKVNTRPEIKYELFEKKAQLARYTNYHEDILKHNDSLQTAILKSRRLPDNIRETREIEHVNEEYHRLANQSQQRIDELKAKVKVHQDYFEGMQTAEKWLLNKSSQIMSASSQDFPSEFESSEESSEAFESQLQEFQGVLEEILYFKTEIQSLHSMSKRLLNEYKDKMPLEGHVKNQLEKLGTTYETVHGAAVQLVQRLKMTVHKQQDFNIRLAEIQSWLSEKEAAVKIAMTYRPVNMYEAQQAVKELAFITMELEEKCEFINENLSSHSAEIEPIKKQIELFQIDLEEKMEIANITATEWQVITEAQDEFKTWLNQTESMLSRLEEVPSEISSNSALAHLEKCKAAIDEIKTKKVVLDGLEEKYNTLLGPGVIEDSEFQDISAQWNHLLTISSNLCVAHERNLSATQDFTTYLSAVETVIENFKSDVEILLRNTSDRTEVRLEKARHIVEEMNRLRKMLENLNNKMQSLTPKMNIHDTESIEDKFRNLNQRWIDCEQKAQSRLQMLDNTLKELSEYKRQLEEMRMWLTEHKVKLSDPVPMTLSVDELNSARQKHSLLCKELTQRKEEFNEITSCHQTLPLNLSIQERELLHIEIADLQKYFREIQKVATDKTSDLNHAIGRRKDLWATAQQAMAWLDHLKESLETYQHPPLYPDAVAKLIQEHRVLHKEIQRHKKTVDDVTATGLRIIYEGKPEGLSVRGKLTGLENKYDEVEQLWLTKLNDLQILLASRELFQADVDRCLRWLKEADIVTFPEVNLAASLQDLENQIGKYHQILSESPTYQDLVEKIKSKAEQIEPELSKVDTDLLVDKMKSIQEHFKTVCAAAEGKTERLDEMMKDRRDYVGELEEFEDYLSVGQTMLQELDDMVTGHTSAQAKVLLSKAEAMQVTLSEQKPNLETIEKMRDSLKNSGQPWQPEELLKSTAIYHRLMQQSAQRIEHFADMVTNREDFERRTDDLEIQLRDTEEGLSCESPSRTEIRLTECQEMAADLTTSQIELRSISGLAEQLCADMEPTDKSIMRERVDQLRKKLHGLQADMGEKQRDLEKRLVSRRDFQGDLEHGVVWLEEMQSAIECDKPLKLDTQSVQEEIKKLQLIQEEVQSRLRMLIALGELEIDKYEEEGEEPPVSVNQKLSHLHQLRESITRAILAKQIRLEDAYAARQRYVGCLSRVQAQLGSASAELQLLDADSSPQHARDLLEQHQALFTTEDEVLQNVEELEEVTKELELSPSLSNTAKRSLAETTSGVRERAGNLLDMAHEIHDNLEKSAVSWEGFDKELEKVTTKLSTTENKLNLVHCEMPGSVHESRYNLEDFQVILSDLASLDHEVQALQKVAESLGSDSITGRMSVNRSIGAVKTRFERLQARSKEIERLLERYLKDWERYHQHVSDANTTLDRIESRMPVKQIEKCTAFDLNTQKSLLMSLNQDLSSMSRRLSTIEDSSHNISGKLNTPRKGDIEREVDNVKENLHRLTEEAGGKLSEVKKEIHVRDSTQADLQDLLQWVEEAKDSADRSVDLTPAPSHVQDKIDVLKQLNEQLGLKKQYFETMSDNLKKKYLDQLSILPAELSTMIGKIRDAFRELEDEIQGKEKELDSAKSLREEYQSELLTISTMLSDSELKLAGGVTEYTATEKEHQALREELDACQVRLVNLDAMASEIAEQTSYESSKISLNAAISAINEHYTRVRELAHARSRKFADASAYLNEIEETHSFLRKWRSKAQNVLAGPLTIQDMHDARTQLRENKALRGQLRELRNEIDRMRDRIPDIGMRSDPNILEEDSFESSAITCETIPSSSFFSKKIDTMADECYDLENKIKEREDLLLSAVASSNEMEEDVKNIRDGVEKLKNRVANKEYIQGLPVNEQLAIKKKILGQLREWKQRLSDVKRLHPFITSPDPSPRGESSSCIVPRLALDTLHEAPTVKLANEVEHAIDDVEHEILMDMDDLASLLREYDSYEEEISLLSERLSSAQHRLKNLPLSRSGGAGTPHLSSPRYIKEELDEYKSLLAEVENLENEIKKLKQKRNTRAEEGSSSSSSPTRDILDMSSDLQRHPVKESFSAVSIEPSQTDLKMDYLLFGDGSTPSHSRSPYKANAELTQLLYQDIKSPSERSDISLASTSSLLGVSILSPDSSPRRSKLDDSAGEFAHMPLPIDASSPYMVDHDRFSPGKSLSTGSRDELGERVKDLLASFREQDNIQSEVQEVTKKLDRCQKRLDSQDREIDLQEQMEVNQKLLDDLNLLQCKLESVERKTGSLAHDYAGKEALNTTVQMLYDRWDTMRMQATSKQNSIEIKILEEEQYSRMVEAYRAELDHVSGWMSDAKIMQEKMEAASSSSRPGTVSTLTDELMTLQNHMKECEKTISDIERKLRLVAELSDKTLTMSRGDKEGEELLLQLDNVKDELENLQKATSQREKLFQDTLETKQDEALEQYQAEVKRMQNWLASVKSHDSSQTRPRNEYKKFLDDLQQHQILLEEVTALGKTLAAQRSALNGSFRSSRKRKNSWDEMVQEFKDKSKSTDKKFSHGQISPSNLLARKTSVGEIKAKLQNLQDCWNELKNQSLDSQEALENLQHQTQEALEAVSNWMDGVEIDLSLKPTTSRSVADQQRLQDVLKNEMGNVQSQMGLLRHVNENISTAINDSKFPESLKSALQLLNERLRSLEQQAKQRELLLAEKDIDQKEFQVEVAYITNEISDLLDEIDQLSPDGSMETVNTRIQELQQTAEEYQEKIQNLMKKGKELESQPWGSNDSDLHQLKQQFENAQSHLKNKTQLFEAINLEDDQFSQLLLDYSDALCTGSGKLKTKKMIVKDLEELKQHLTKFKDYFDGLQCQRALCMEMDNKLQPVMHKLHEKTFNELLLKHSELENRAVTQQQQLMKIIQKWDQLNDELKHRRTTVMSLEREIPFELIEEDDMVEIADKIDKLQLIQKRISELESDIHHALDTSDHILEVVKCENLKSKINEASEKLILIRSSVDQEVNRLQTIREFFPRYVDLTTSICDWFEMNMNEPGNIVAEMETFNYAPTQVQIKCERFQEIVREFEKIKMSQEELKKNSGKLLKVKSKNLEEMKRSIQDIEDQSSEMQKKLPMLNERLHKAQIQLLPVHQAISEMMTWIQRMNTALDLMKQENYDRAGSEVLKNQLATYKGYQMELRVKQLTIEFINKSSTSADPFSPRKSEVEFADKLGQLNMEWEILKARVENCVNQTEPELIQWSEHEKSIKKIQQWLDDQIEDFSHFLSPGSSSQIQRYLLELQGVEGKLKKKYSDILKLEKEYKDLVSFKSEHLCSESPEPGCGSSDLAKLFQTLSILEHHLNQEKRNLKKALDQWSRFTSAEQVTNKQLDSIEHSLLRSKISHMSMDIVADHLLLLENLEHELRRHSLQQQLLQLEASSLVPHCDSNTTDDIRKKLNGLDARWNELSESVQTQISKYKKALDVWREYENQYNEIESRLELVKSQSESVNTSQSMIDDPQQCEMKAEELMNTCKALQTSVLKLSSFSERLSKLMDPSSSLHVNAKNARLEHEITNTAHDLQSTIRLVGNEKSKIAEFKEKLGFLETWLKDAAALVEQEEASLDETVIQDQMDELKIQLQTFKSYSSSLDELNSLGYQLPLQDLHINRLRNLNSKWVEVSKLTVEKFHHLQSLHLHNLNFIQKCETWMLFIAQMESSLTTDIAASYEGLLEQSRTLELFSVEMMGRQLILQAIVTDGEKLLENGSEEEKAEFKSKLDQLNTQWQLVLGRMQQRKIAIDEALKLWSDYNYQKNQFESWIETTKKQIRDLESGKCIHHTVHGLKSDIEKLKLIEKSAMVNEVKCSSMLEAGKDVLPITRDESHAELKKDLSALHNEWLAINKTLQQKKRELQALLSRWNECESKITDMLGWLRDTKKILATSEYVEHEEIHSAMIKCRDREIMFDMTGDKLRSLEVNAEELRSEISRADIALLRQRVELVRQQWEELREQTQQRKNSIENRLSEWDDFGDKYKDLCEWLTGYEQKISRTLDLPIEELLDRLTKEYQEEMIGAQDRRAELRTLGDKLICGASRGGRSQDIEYKLNKMSDRWENLEKMNKIRAKKLRETIQAVVQLEKSMEDLRTWLKDVEDGLQSPVLHTKCDDEDVIERLKEQQVGVIYYFYCKCMLS